MPSLAYLARSPVARRARRSAVLAAAAILLMACGGPERPSLIGPEAAPVDELGRQDEASSEVGAGDNLGAAGATTTALDESLESGTGSITTGDANTGEGNSTGGTSVTVAASDINPVAGGVRAIVTPTGVLAAVLGEAGGAYVVESPCGIPTSVPWGQPLRSIDVMLDPGHGGDEQGAVAESGLTEASINLRVARRAAALLADREITVALTRTADYRVPIAQRANLADALGARALVSIHHNTPKAADSTIPGTEVYVQSTSVESRRLGGLIYQKVVADLARFDVKWVSRTDAGVLTVLNAEGQDAYGINRRPATPSALVEIGYLANPAEAALFATEGYVTVVAESLAVGIEQFLTTTDSGSGFIDAPRSFAPSGDPADNTGGQSGCVDPPLN